MKKWALLTTAIILGVGSLYVGAQNNESEPLTQLVKHPQHWQVMVPDTQSSIHLDAIEKLQQQPYLVGHYQGENEGDNSTIYLDTNQIKQSNNYLASTFIMTNSGSGSFYYLALFKENANKINNVANVFIGDRIAVEKINILKTDPVTIQIDYKTHGENTPYALPADVAKSQVYVLDNNQLVLKK
ncbi:TPA: hypothetical protein ACX6S7_001070 [Photobacterium damselae]